MKKIVLAFVAFSVFDVSGMIRSGHVDFTAFNSGGECALDNFRNMDPDSVEVEEDDDLDGYPTTEVSWLRADLQASKNDSVDENLTPTQREIVSRINGCNCNSSHSKTIAINSEDFLYALDFIEKHLELWSYKFTTKLSQRSRDFELDCLLKRSAKKDIGIYAILSVDLPKNSWGLESGRYYCYDGNWLQIEFVNEFFKGLKEQIKNLNSCTICVGKCNKFGALYLDAIFKFSKD